MIFSSARNVLRRSSKNKISDLLFYAVEHQYHIIITTTTSTNNIVITIIIVHQISDMSFSIGYERLIEESSVSERTEVQSRWQWLYCNGYWLYPNVLLQWLLVMVIGYGYQLWQWVMIMTTGISNGFYNGFGNVNGNGKSNDHASVMINKTILFCYQFIQMSLENLCSSQSFTASSELL